ncbi:hypothetical protein D3C80_1690160 [compost metagenome]
MAGDADQVALGNIVAPGELQAVVIDFQHLFATFFIAKLDLGRITLASNGLDRAVAGGTLRRFGMVGKVLGDAVPAPLVGNHRGRVIQAAGQADQDQRRQPVPGPLGFLVFDHRCVP